MPILTVKGRVAHYRIDLKKSGEKVGKAKRKPVLGGRPIFLTDKKS